MNKRKSPLGTQKPREIHLFGEEATDNKNAPAQLMILGREFIKAIMDEEENLDVSSDDLSQTSTSTKPSFFDRLEKKWRAPGLLSKAKLVTARNQIIKLTTEIEADLCPKTEGEDDDFGVYDDNGDDDINDERRFSSPRVH